ncbi:MAG TPA: RNA polymerase sigma factor [Usitatibacter sp.]|nr:RNA polymerase sigma factor [Usitatibacter sp.]
MSALPAAARTTNLPDSELVERARTGDVHAIEQIIRKYNRKLYRTARAILRDDAEAEDAVQEAYLQAFKGLAGFRGDSSLSTWLTRIAANEALMRLRRNTRRSAVIPLHGDGESVMEDLHGDEAPTPELEAMGNEVRRILEKQVDALPDLYRTVFVLRAIEEMSVEETSAALNLPEATVRTRYFRARALLRTALERRVDDSLRDTFAFDGARCDRIVGGVLAKLAR